MSSHDQVNTVPQFDRELTDAELEAVAAGKGLAGLANANGGGAAGPRWQNPGWSYRPQGGWQHRGWGFW
jgi:hypothetical protein